METSEPTKTESTPPKLKSKKGMSKPVIALMLLALITVSVTAGYWYSNHKAKQQLAQTQAQFNQTAQLLSNASKEINDLKAKTETTNTGQATTPPSQATLNSIKDAITSGNTAALAGYMVANPSVAIAASEYSGPKSQTEAVMTITNYIKDAKDPWDFSIPTATINEWAKNSYKDYFPQDVLVGEAANKMVIAFSFDSTGKISSVLLVANSDQLAY